jgi:hypothetical protein
MQQHGKRAGADGGHAVHQRKVNAHGRGLLGVGLAQRVERDDQSARSRTGNTAHHVGGDGVIRLIESARPSAGLVLSCRDGA